MVFIDVINVIEQNDVIQGPAVFGEQRNGHQRVGSKVCMWVREQNGRPRWKDRQGRTGETG